MKPRSKQQEFMVEWAKAHTTLTPRHKQYANSHCFWEVALVSRGKCYCTKCKGTWRDKEAQGKPSVTCPHCGKKLEVTAHKTKTNMSAYFSVFTTVNGMQVCKWYNAFRNCKNDGTEKYSYAYLGAEFLLQNGKIYSVEIARCQIGWNREQWSYGSEPEIRGYSFFRSYIMGRASYYDSVLPILKQRGFKTNRAYEGREMSVMIELLTNPKVESLVKIGHVGVVWDWMRLGGGFTDGELTAIKLANRHHIVFDSIDKWNDYKDYIRDLRTMGKDVHNPTILFPQDFQKAHQELHEKVQAKRRREEQEEERQRRLGKMLRERERQRWISDYAAKFTGMELTSGTFTIKPLISLEEFKTEADAMHHCIVTYYGKTDRLLLSIECNGKKCETAEINLKEKVIEQCRGCCNRPSEHHDIIVKMLKHFMNEFVRRYKSNPKQQNTLPVLASVYKTYQTAI